MMAPSLAKPLPDVPAGSAIMSEEYLKIRDDLEKIKNSPKPKGWINEQGWVMATVHCFMLDMIMRVYAFAEQAVEKDDLVNYLGFADMTFAQICHHHHFEEEEMFPFFQKVTGKDLMNANVIQHHLFAPQLGEAWSYVRQCRHNLNPLLVPPVKEVLPEIEKLHLGSQGGSVSGSDSETSSDLDPAHGFDSRRLRNHMDGWVVVMARHLYDEIDTLKPANLEGFGNKEIKEAEKVVDSHLRGFDPTWFLCSTVAMMPIGASKTLMGLPAPVRRLLVPYVFARKHWGIWPYCSHPENLTFSGSA